MTHSVFVCCGIFRFKVESLAASVKSKNKIYGFKNCGLFFWNSESEFQILKFRLHISSLSSLRVSTDPDV